MDDEQLTTTATAPAVAAGVAVREWISSIDVSRLSDRERLDLVAEMERIKHTAAAAQAKATHALRTSREAASPQDAVRSVGAEVALARRQSPTLGDRFVGMARALVDEMPHTMAALTEGVCSERHALLMVQVTSVLTLEDRAEVDRRVGPLLGRLGVRGAERAARRVAQELDVAAAVRRHADAVRSRRVTVRPAPDGMAYLTVLGPMVDVVGASAALRRRAQAVVAGQCLDEGPAGRAAGAVAADTALRLLSGRDVGQVQPVEVHLVMTDRSLLGTGDPGRSVREPARVPGHGSLPAPIARRWVRGPSAADGGGRGDGRGRAGAGGGGPDGADGRGLDGDAREHEGADASASVWLRRLYTSPDGCDLVAMDSRRRLFTGLLRRMLVLRDDVCTTPWCEAPIAHADHTVPARDDGPTSFVHGTGKCARCNYGKEAPGWVTVVGTAPVGASTAPTDLPGPDLGMVRREVRVMTPLGRRYVSQPPPLLGWGSVYPDQVRQPVSIGADQVRQPVPAGAVPVSATGLARSERRRRRRTDRARHRKRAEDAVTVRRVPFSRHLERELCRLLT